MTRAQPPQINEFPDLNVIFVHGMGNQWPLADLTGIVLSLEQRGRAHGITLERPQEFNESAKFQRLGFQGNLLGVETTLQVVCGAETVKRRIRFYDLYWAPLARHSPSVADMAAFAWQQILPPLRNVLARWARLPHLRLAILEQVQRAHQTPPQVVAQLRNDYLKFRQAHWNHENASRFRLFRQQVTANSGEQGPEAQLLAQWKRSNHTYHGVSLFAVSSLLTLFMLITFSVVLTLPILFNLSESGNTSKVLPFFRFDYGFDYDRFFVNTYTWFLGLIFILWHVGLKKYVVDYLGDAVIWASYHETESASETRSQILQRSEAVFNYVLKQREETLVLSHSLGTVVSHDTLLRLCNTSPKGLSFIRAVLTTGSPIDKFSYFFESQGRRGILDEDFITRIRSNVFSHTTRLKWLNCYEVGDAISGYVDTVDPFHYRQGTGGQLVNLYTPNAWTPLVLANHSRYFENTTVLDELLKLLLPCDWPQHSGAATPQIARGLHMQLMYVLQAILLATPFMLIMPFFIQIYLALSNKNCKVGALDHQRLVLWSSVTPVLLMGLLLAVALLHYRLSKQTENPKPNFFILVYFAIALGVLTAMFAHPAVQNLCSWRNFFLYSALTNLAITGVLLLINVFMRPRTLMAAK